MQRASQVALVGKNLPAHAEDVRDASLISGSGRSPGGGRGIPLQCSCLENPVDRGAWRAAPHRAAHGWAGLKRLSRQAQKVCVRPAAVATGAQSLGPFENPQGAASEPRVQGWSQAVSSVGLCTVLLFLPHELLDCSCLLARKFCKCRGSDHEDRRSDAGA